jgi:membrane protein DedA with SNARE-associated domain
MPILTGREPIIRPVPRLARVTHLLLTYGLVLLFVAIAIESAGVPIPGETALITAAVFATPKYHHFSLWSVIVVAAAGAIVGDNAGYALGRFGGRRLLERWGFVRRYAERSLPPAERFFAKHGQKTVFFGRFVALLRVTSAWLAGISHMAWWRFLIWNALGGIAWAITISLIAYYFGQAVADASSRYGLYAVGALIVIGALVFIGLRIFRKRIESA